MEYVLVVDDSKTIAKGLQSYIAKIIPDVTCLVGFCLEDAKNLLEKYEGIECALLDLHLPDAPNGEIVNFVANYKIPIVVLTGQTNMEDKIKASTIVDYVIKDGIYSLQYASNIVKQVIKNKNIKVLVVDDSKVALENTAIHLKNYNLTVLKASNGKEALEVIKENPDIKLVYTDYNMPVMDGLELIRELRRKYSKKQMSIIAVSSHTDKKISSMLLKYGANDYLNKNYNSEEFYARLNLNLETLELFDNIDQEYEKNRQKDQIIQEQNKMSAITELIKNIGHHWRQPLAAISANAGSLKIDCELDMLNPEEIVKRMDSIISSTKFLSNTIETFRDIIDEGIDAKELVLQDEIDKVIELEIPSLDGGNIKIIKKIDYDNLIKMDLVAGDLNKVLIYIINNANDILTKQELTDKWIEISLKSTSHSVLISVEDNGGGVPDEIITKIFEPYFTTKHQSPGTGLGLHMGYQIVTENLKGKLYVANTSNGAKFTIELPLKK